MEIVIERGKVVKLKELPEYSIALDGFVQGPEIDSDHHRFSFDHHAGCIRFCTSAACMQARDAVLLGLNPELYSVFANDVDSDVCAAIWCLKNPSRCKEPLVEKLINAIGKGDMFAGAVDLNGMKKVVEWISAPQTSSIRTGDYEKLSDEGLKSILESVLHRIDQYVEGNASVEVAKQETYDDFKVLRKEHGWVLVESSDPHILSTVWTSGFERAVIVRNLEDGSVAATIARKSDFVDNFPLKKIFKALNEYDDTTDGSWGGSPAIGGSPRNSDGSRSKLSIEEMTKIIDHVICPEDCPVLKKKKINGSSKKKSGPKSIKTSTK